MMTLFLIVLVLLICSQFHLSEMAVGRALVKAGDDFTFDSVPGRLLVKRTTKAHADPQYLWAGAGQQCGATSVGGWTTDGKNQIGNATLEWESGKMVIKNFTAEDAGGYTFPLEEPHPNLAPTLLVMELDES